ncbi:MAG: sulfotransferase [Halofilum sp. (in: g-proteobacteria)]|nr:sulfotransferase [Halofilum sp. (in: g-proteobacteria)]
MSRIDCGWNSDHPPPAIFILTGVRCGSTLLKAMLDQHPRLFAPPELNLWPFETAEEAGLQFRHTHLSRGLTETVARVLGSMQRAEAQVARFHEQQTPVPEIVEWIRQRIGDRMLVDKSPTYPMSPRILERIESLGACADSGPRYILLTRHPLDVFESMERNGFDRLLKVLTANARRLRRHRPELGSEWFEAYAETPDNPCRDVLGIAQSNYLRAMTHSREFLEGIPGERWISLSYESIVGRPEQAMREVCEFLELPFDPAMLDPYGTGTVAAETVQDPNFLQHDGIDATCVPDPWQHHVRWARTELAESTHQLARFLGYSLPATVTHSPLTPAQERFIAAHGGPADFYMVMAQDLEFEQRALDLGQLYCSLIALARRIPALRALFECREGCWIQRHAITPAAGVLRFEDLRPLPDAGAREARIDDRVRATRESIDPETGAPWRLLLFRLGERSYRVVYLFHHLVTDGLSLLWFDRALWQAYFDGDSEGAAPPPVAPDYPTRLELLRRERDLSADLAFYQAVMEQPDALADGLCLVERGRGPGSVRERVTRVPLPRRTRRSGLQFEAVALALHQAVGELADIEAPLIAHRHARRDALRRAGHEHWMGWIAGDVPIRIDVREDALVQRRALRSALRSLPLGGVSYDWLVLDDELPALDRVAAVRLNYVPAVRLKQHPGARFSLPGVRAQPGEGMAPEYPIDFLVREFDGELEVVIRYAHQVVNELHVQLLLGLWRTRFEALAAAFAGRRTDPALDAGSRKIAV